MRLLIEIGYTKLLLAEGADTGAFFKMLSEATPVEEKDTKFSEPNKYAVKCGASDLSFPQFITDSQLIDEEEAAELDIDQLTKKSDRDRQERNAAVAKLAELEKKVAALTGKADV
jgi:hypothetical protein